MTINTLAMTTSLARFTALDSCSSQGDRGARAPSDINRFKGELKCISGADATGAGSAESSKMTGSAESSKMTGSAELTETDRAASVSASLIRRTNGSLFTASPLVGRTPLTTLSFSIEYALHLTRPEIGRASSVASPRAIPQLSTPDGYSRRFNFPSIADVHSASAFCARLPPTCRAAPYIWIAPA
jgi:hypothetical protein